MPGELVPAVELAGVTKRYGQTLALNDVTLRVEPGEIVALLGPNGAGKTTAISLMLGLRRPDAGTARLFGANPRDPAARRRLAAMLQESGVPPTLLVREVVALFRSLYPNPLAAESVIALADLTHRAAVRVATLSAGERQRLYFALALVANADVLFLDEPTAALDVETRRRFWIVIRDLVREGKTIVLTTHYLEEADALANRIIVIDHGRVVASGTPAEIKARVGGRYVRFTATNVDELVLSALPGIQRVSRNGNRWTLLTLSPEASLALLFARGVALEHLEVEDAGLEEAFVALTKSPVVAA